MASELYEPLCVDGCNDTASSDADGGFALTVPVSGPTLIRGAGLVTAPPGATDAFRSGKTRIMDCPIDPVVLFAVEGTDLFPLQITLSGDGFAWDPPVTASRVFVTQSQKYLKWAVLGPMLSPAQYGVVPGAAIQDIPSDGNPPREGIRARDLIRIYAEEPGDGFYDRSYEGLLEVP